METPAAPRHILVSLTTAILPIDDPNRTLVDFIERHIGTAIVNVLARFGIEVAAEDVKTRRTTSELMTAAIGKTFTVEVPVHHANMSEQLEVSIATRLREILSDLVVSGSEFTHNPREPMRFEVAVYTTHKRVRL